MAFFRCGSGNNNLLTFQYMRLSKTITFSNFGIGNYLILMEAARYVDSVTGFDIIQSEDPTYQSGQVYQATINSPSITIRGSNSLDSMLIK